MLQRAASNAYSWWWASHIRTKQSKWLEQNLQDMEEKVNNTLQIIDDDGDTFAKRAEMYYRKRPELLNFVEESFRAYRALAERYDHLSRELQNANRTIATVFPEQVQLAIDDDEEDNLTKKATHLHDPNRATVPKPIISKIPKIPRTDFKPPTMLTFRKGQSFKRTSSSVKTTVSSGLSKTEALSEIDKLQKEILALQTEKEFVKSSYECGLAKYWEIESQITEMQRKVSSLQDEFGIGTVIEDDEARKLMAATALKSCQQTLMKLQQKQEQSAEEAKEECHKIKEAREKLDTLKDEFLHKKMGHRELPAEREPISTGPGLKNLDHQVDNVGQERHDLDLLREKIKEHLEVNSATSLTVTELAEKIDEIVDKVITLETAVSSQTALVKRLRLETDELQAHIRTLEEDKESLIEDSDNMSNKLRELEEELHRVKNLNNSVEDQNINLQTNFTEASCNLDHLSEKLESVKLEEEVHNMGLFQELGAVPDAKPKRDLEKHEDTLASATGSEILRDRRTEAEEKADDTQDSGNSVKAKEEENFVESNSSNNLDVLSEESLEPKQQQEDEKQDLAQTVASDLDTEPQKMGKEGEDQPNWRQLFLIGLEDREKILLEEYTSVLRSFKEVKKKLNEVEKKNRDGLFELAMQIKELKNANALKDEEIQSLVQTLGSLQQNPDENLQRSSTGYKLSKQEDPHESIARTSTSLSNISFLEADQEPVSGLLDEQNVVPARKVEESTEFKGKTDESIAQGSMNSPTKVEENVIRVISTDEACTVSTIEEKFRSEIDDLLEENLEFWLRFSTSFNQIQKFQNSIQDLQAEYSKLMESKKQDGSTRHQSLKSDARPIYTHLREILTEITLWLEHNALLKDELQSRFSSLCNIQEEISRVSNAGSKAEESEMSDYQAAKFQGEILNMKQENNKVANELLAGLHRVRGFQAEIQRTLSKLDEDFGISGTKSQHSHMKPPLNRPRIPLRSFLFGVKLKKQKPSIFSCMSPALQKQYSDLTSAPQ